jgi:SAM-dependent methyltransferase
VTFVQKYSKEIEQLKEIEFLDEEDSMDLILEGFYQSPIWPEVFWRRRKSHAKRPDPEIPVIEKLHPKTVLEIGSAYGRVTRKILAREQQMKSSPSSMEVTGLELNHHFEKYISLHSTEYPDLSKAKFIYGNIFDAKAIFSGSAFDLVIIPMHTLPNFPFEKVASLFESLRHLVKKNGHCIFSIHNRKFNADSDLFKKDWMDGELLVERGKNSIASVCYGFPIKQTAYGYSSVYYCKYYILNKKMCSENKIINRSVTEYINVEVMKDIIVKNGFIIEFIDATSFSRVYCIKKE